jgi:hypothetical protein
MFTEKSFKIMLKDIFEYLFDLQNLELFLKINYQRALSVLLLPFQQRIQDIFKSIIEEDKPIKVRLSKAIEEGLLLQLIGNIEKLFITRYR